MKANRLCLLLLFLGVLLACCKRASNESQDFGGRQEHFKQRRFISLPGALTDFEIITSSENTYTLRVHSDVGAGKYVEYTGPGHFGEEAIALWCFDKDEAIKLINDGTGVYVRNGMAPGDALLKGWCVAETVDRQYVHADRVIKFVESHKPPNSSVEK